MYEILTITLFVIYLAFQVVGFVGDGEVFKLHQNPPFDPNTPYEQLFELGRLHHDDD